MTYSSSTPPHGSHSAQRKRKRRCYRDKLNSSDDVVGVESYTPSSDEGPPSPSRSASDSPYDHADPAQRRAARLQDFAYRYQQSPPRVQEVYLGAKWTKVGSQWRLTVPTRGLPTHLNPLRVRFQPWQLPATPAQFEIAAYEQNPDLKNHSARISLVEFTSASGGQALSMQRPCLTPWAKPGPGCAVEALPAPAYGAASPSSTTDFVAEAFRLVRQNHRLAGLMQPKPLRAMLSAQSKSAQRLVEAPDTATQKAILLAAAKRTGMTSLLHGDAQPDTQSATSPVTQSKKDLGFPVPSSLPSVPTSSPKQRWLKRNQVTTEQESSGARSGWRVIRRETRLQTDWALTDEWSVPVSSQLRLNIPGVILCEDPTEAATWHLHLKGTSAPCAIVSRKKLSLPESTPVLRTAFHLKRLQRDPQDQARPLPSPTIPVIGFIYQLCEDHAVALRQAPQTSTQASQGSTLVIRLLTAAAFAPPDVWDGLSRGKFHHLKAELVKQLQSTAPAQAPCIYDAFRLERQGQINRLLREDFSECSPARPCHFG